MVKRNTGKHFWPIGGTFIMRHRHSIPKRGGRGGNAIAEGDESTAVGGDAGQFNGMPGGRGGDARATLLGSTIIGGKGGRGGIEEGMPGMDVSDAGLSGGFSLRLEGGMGGESSQRDGRGGRGGLSGGAERLQELLGRDPRPHMSRPYWLGGPVEYGRGGDGADTPQYQARRLIVEMIKAEHQCAPSYFTTEVWYQREEVDALKINLALERMGAGWRISIEDHEYVMNDLID